MSVSCVYGVIFYFILYWNIESVILIAEVHCRNYYMLEFPLKRLLTIRKSSEDHELNASFSLKKVSVVIKSFSNGDFLRPLAKHDLMIHILKNNGYHQYYYPFGKCDPLEVYTRWLCQGTIYADFSRTRKSKPKAICRFILFY